MARGEKPTELGNSWFSAKSIEVERLTFCPHAPYTGGSSTRSRHRKRGGIALDGRGEPTALLSPRKLRIPLFLKADRPWALRSEVKRETAQTGS